LDVLTDAYFLDKLKGKKTTLRVFLRKHPELREEYEALSPEEKSILLSDLLEAKEEKEIIPKNISNVSLSKIIDFRIRHITSIVSLLAFLIYCSSDPLLVPGAQSALWDREPCPFQPW
jgi:hypothetical protein